MRTLTKACVILLFSFLAATVEHTLEVTPTVTCMQPAYGLSAVEMTCDTQNPLLEKDPAGIGIGTFRSKVMTSATLRFFITDVRHEGRFSNNESFLEVIYAPSLVSGGPSFAL